MTQEDKSLLLCDLCARLPYGVKVWYKYGAWYLEKFATSIRLADEKIALSHKFNKEGNWFPVEEAGEILIKPYIRPMSSMTKDEYKELKSISPYYGFAPYEYIGDWCPNYEMINWLNKYHFDYHGLIPKGLAIEDKSIKYLKSIKDRVQPKQEWSEEQLKLLNELMSFLLTDCPKQWEKYGELLKSIKLQNTWKPSDEQMKLLREVQAALLGKDCHNRFVNFMYELKRLKEG